MAKEQGTPYLLFAVIIAAFGGFLYGYHTGIIAGALVFLTQSFHLSIIDQGVVVSIILVGALLIALAESYSFLLIGRLISGIGVGLISLTGPLYLAEISPAHRRGAIVAGYQLAITLGILASFIVNYLFSHSA